jgi:uncharacterized delta-60 repeat protein
MSILTALSLLWHYHRRIDSRRRPFAVSVTDRDGDTITFFNLIRVGPSGALDQNFYPDPDSGVACLVVQPDGRILLSGAFSRLDAGNSDVPRLGLARIERNGRVDNGFNPAIDGWVNSMVLQTDGKILLGGSFNQLGGQPRSRIGRLNPNGTVDSTFNPGADGSVYSLAVQNDGRILAGGDFATLGGQGRSKIGRIQNTTPATESLNLAGSTITWLRGDTSPEVSRPHLRVHHRRSTMDYRTRCTDCGRLAAYGSVPAGRYSDPGAGLRGLWTCGWVGMGGGKSLRPARLRRSAGEPHQ